MQIDRKLVSKKELKSLGIPYSFQHIARLEKARQFPQRVQLGLCRVAWSYEEVCHWIDERIARRKPNSQADKTPDRAHFWGLLALSPQPFFTARV